MAGLNQTAAERDLFEIMRRADADGNEVITFDELYELITGKPIYPLVAPFVRDWALLKTPRTAETKWERWTSLLIAPQLKRLSQLSSISRRLYDRSVSKLEELAEDARWECQRIQENALRKLAGQEQLPPERRPSQKGKAHDEAESDSLTPWWESFQDRD